MSPGSHVGVDDHISKLEPPCLAPVSLCMIMNTSGRSTLSTECKQRLGWEVVVGGAEVGGNLRRRDP